jgi:hypothetical protein
MRDGRIGSDHRIDLAVSDRSHGPARDALRRDLLVELGLAATAS